MLRVRRSPPKKIEVQKTMLPDFMTVNYTLQIHARHISFVGEVIR